MVGGIVVVIGVDFKSDNTKFIDGFLAAFPPAGKCGVYDLYRAESGEFPDFTKQGEVVYVWIVEQDRLGGCQPDFVNLVGCHGFIQMMKFGMSELLGRPVAERAVGINKFHFV